MISAEIGLKRPFQSRLLDVFSELCEGTFPSSDSAKLAAGAAYIGVSIQRLRHIRSPGRNTGLPKARAAKRLLEFCEGPSLHFILTGDRCGFVPSFYPLSYKMRIDLVLHTATEYYGSREAAYRNMGLSRLPSGNSDIQLRTLQLLSFCTRVDCDWLVDGSIPEEGIRCVESL